MSTTDEPPRKKRRVQVCSFCHEPGHTIRGCDSSRFEDLISQYIHFWISRVSSIQSIDVIATAPFIAQLSDKSIDAYIYYYTPLMPSKLSPEFKKQVIEEILQSRYVMQKVIYSENVRRLLTIIRDAIRTTDDDERTACITEYEVIHGFLPNFYKQTLVYGVIISGMVYDYIRIFLKGEMTSTIKTILAKTRKWKINIVQETESTDDEECPICYDKQSCLKTNCGHTVCNPCFTKIIQKTGMQSGPQCPMCRAVVTDVHTNDTSFEIV